MKERGRGTQQRAPGWEQNPVHCSEDKASVHGTPALGMLTHSEFLSLELRGQAQLLKNNPTPKSPSTKLYTWHNAVRQVPFSWQPPKPDSSIRLPDAETQFLTPEKASPLLCSPVVACFTPLHPRSCSAMETHSMKLSMNMRPHEVLRFIAVDSAESWRPLCTLCVSIC